MQEKSSIIDFKYSTFAHQANEQEFNAKIVANRNKLITYLILTS
jgi:hypothetical protein